jgi:hypothetical protein
MRLLDGKPYTHSTATDVRRTWEMFGFKPTTDEDRAEAQRRRLGGVFLLEDPEMEDVA